MAKSDNNLLFIFMRPFSTVIDPILIFLDVLKRYEPISFIFDINVVIAVTMTMSISDYVHQGSHVLTNPKPAEASKPSKTKIVR